MKDIALVAALIGVYGGLMITIAVMLVFLDKARKLLNQIRKLASLYPPYPIFTDPKSGDEVDRTKVEIQQEWDDDIDGRS
jgi:hypothetical protein